jgi:hypothetical protein
MPSEEDAREARDAADQVQKWLENGMQDHMQKCKRKAWVHIYYKEQFLQKAKSTSLARWNTGARPPPPPAQNAPPSGASASLPTSIEPLQHLTR